MHVLGPAYLLCAIPPGVISPLPAVGSISASAKMSAPGQRHPKKSWPKRAPKKSQKMGIKPLDSDWNAADFRGNLTNEKDPEGPFFFLHG